MSGERAALESGLSGQYVLERELGHGGMATVYLARDLKHKRPVALKVLRSEIAANLGADRFRREIETAARLQHPHILSVHDSGEAGGHLWFTMPYVRGESLRDRLRREGRLPVQEAIRITGEAAQALQYAHGEGVVHRDIKPENILLTADGATLVADFGIARAVAGGTGQTQHLTETGFAVGTPAYMAPEQALGERQVDTRADQYALAVTCYEMLAGVPPFTGPTPAAMIAKRFSQANPPLVNQDRPDTPGHLDAVLRRALALKPDDRYGSMSEFQRALSGNGGAPAPTIALPSRASARGAVQRVVAGVAMLALVISLVVLARGLPGEAGEDLGSSAAPAATPAAPAVIAVLPMDEPSERGYVGVAYARELARSLGQFGSLRVLGPDGMESYRSGEDRLKRLARQLRARSVLEGTTRSVEGTVHIDLRLLAIPSGQVLWTFAEQRPSSELAALTGELARGIATALGARLGAPELSRVARPPTAVPEAYGAYLRSTALEESNRAQNEAGMDLLRAAIRQDTAFALAWATLARRFLYHGFFVSLSYRDSGMAAVKRALELNPDLDEGHFVQGDLQMLSGRHATAQYSYLKAIELNPSHAAAMADLSSAQSTIGRFDESLYWALRGLALYPDAPQLYHHVSIPLVMLADDSASLRWLEAGVRRWPDFARLENAISLVELRQGRDSAALARLRRVHRSAPTDEEVLTSLAQVAWMAGASDGDSLALARYRAAPDARPFGTMPYTFRTLVAATRLHQGDKASARALVDSALGLAQAEFERGGEDPAPAIEAAALMALRGSHQEALDWLERAHQVGYRDYRWVPRDPLLRTLARNPRLDRLLARMESEVALMRRRASEAHDSLFRRNRT